MATNVTMDDLLQRLKEFSVAMLTTITPAGYIHSRPMMTQESEGDADLWFVSALDTEKIAEIRANPKIGVVYFRDRDNAYVSLSGDAQIREDRQLIHDKWQESWRPWFPEGPDQQNICMIKVDAKEVEMWEPAGGYLRQRLEIARAYLTGDQAKVNPPIEATIDQAKEPPERRSA
ncbi:MAG: pyridoxamine 5'-phosphate oxidase family protein [Candidatus Sericytochromatia bacterium]|nr:pyridoxamine 5'-phosphate oxidase family protein [Candidatus Sericytochromatia bacterium]